MTCSQGTCVCVSHGRKHNQHSNGAATIPRGVWGACPGSHSATLEAHTMLWAKGLQACRGEKSGMLHAGVVVAFAKDAVWRPAGTVTIMVCRRAGASKRRVHAPHARVPCGMPELLALHGNASGTTRGRHEEAWARDARGACSGCHERSRSTHAWSRHTRRPNSPWQCRQAVVIPVLTMSAARKHAQCQRGGKRGPCRQKCRYPFGSINKRSGCWPEAACMRAWSAKQLCAMRL